MGRKILPDNTIDQLVRAGRTDTEIARHLLDHENIQVTRQGVSAWRYRNGRDQTKRATVHSMPWKLRKEHESLEAARVIRWYGRRQAGLPLADEELQRLEKAERQLGKVDGVFDYLPESEFGFVIVRRRDGVDKGIVREPDA